MNGSPCTNRRTLCLNVATYLGTLCCLSSLSCADTSIPGIGPTGTVTKIAGNFQFTEGPAYDGKQYLYFTDIPANRIYRWDAIAKKPAAPEVFIEPAGTCNGLMFDGQERMIACRMEGELVSFDIATKEATTLVGQYEGKRFNACNDLVIDREGGVYFTDPRFRAPEPWPQGKEAIYYRAPGGETKRLADDFDAPNGVILSPDETKLYVIPSMDSTMYVYDVSSPGTLSNRRPFCQLKTTARPIEERRRRIDGRYPRQPLYHFGSRPPSILSRR